MKARWHAETEEAWKETKERLLNECAAAWKALGSKKGDKLEPEKFTLAQWEEHLLRSARNRKDPLGALGGKVGVMREEARQAGRILY